MFRKEGKKGERDEKKGGMQEKRKVTTEEERIVKGEGRMESRERNWAQWGGKEEEREGKRRRMKTEEMDGEGGKERKLERRDGRRVYMDRSKLRRQGECTEGKGRR